MGSARTASRRVPAGTRSTRAPRRRSSADGRVAPAAVAVLAALLLPGCTEPLADPAQPAPPDGALPEPEVPAGPAPDPGGGEGGTPPGAPALEEAGPGVDRIEFTACTGGETTVRFPPTMGPGEPVPGWPDAPPTVTTLSMGLVQCERMRWGPFERPVTFLWEAHDRQTPDQGCMEFGETQGFLLALHALWIGDAEVAAWAEATFGMPARVADFEVTEAAAAGGVEERTWRWRLPSGETSELTFRAGEAQPTSAPLTMRMAWKGGGLLHLMDLQQHRERDWAQGVAVPGTLGESMLYRRVAPEPYAGIGEAIDRLGLAADLWHFEDMACAKQA